jgi:hypothetical protein
MPTIVFANSKGGAGKSASAFGGSLSDLDRGQVGNVQAAVANARALAGEVLSILKPSTGRAEVEEAA